MSDGYEIEELTRIEAALDALVSPTSEDVFQATRPYDERAIASVAAKRAGEGGGAQPSVQVYGPYTVAHDTPGATTVLWNAKAGDLILDLFVIPTIAWSGGASLDIYCDQDILRPRESQSNLSVVEDGTRVWILNPGQVASVGGAANSNINLLPSLMKTDADVICDIAGSPAVGEAVIYALVFPA